MQVVDQDPASQYDHQTDEPNALFCCTAELDCKHHKRLILANESNNAPLITRYPDPPQLYPESQLELTKLWRIMPNSDTTTSLRRMDRIGLEQRICIQVWNGIRRFSRCRHARNDIALLGDKWNILMNSRSMNL
jgi:hypothetical protein